MPVGFSRTHRIAEQMQRELASLIQFDVQDPRLGMVTVNHVKVSKDLSYADAYVSVMSVTTHTSEKEQIAASLDVLNQAAGYLRTQLGQRMRLRVIPRLRFHYDETLAQGQRVMDLIKTGDKPGKTDKDS